MDIAALLENQKKEKGFTPESFCEAVLNEYGYRAHALATLMVFDKMDADLAGRWVDGSMVYSMTYALFLHKHRTHWIC